MEPEERWATLEKVKKGFKKHKIKIWVIGYLQEENK